MNTIKALLKIQETKVDQDKYAEIVRRMFSNITSPAIFPDQGNDDNSIEWLIRQTDVPFQDEELLGIKIMKHLVKWEFGIKCLFRNSKVVAYVLDRVPKPKEVVEQKFRLVEKVI